MVHVLSARHRSEFLAVPALARLTMAHGQDGLETTLLIKASNLTLKYLVRMKRLRMALLRAGTDALGYGVEVQDDPAHPALLWSLLEHDLPPEKWTGLSRSALGLGRADVAQS